jgi:hypothetical protein
MMGLRTTVDWILLPGDIDKDRVGMWMDNSTQCVDQIFKMWKRKSSFQDIDSDAVPQKT